MKHYSRRPRFARSLDARSRRTADRRGGQVLLVAVLLMIVIAVLGSTCAALLVSAQVNPATSIPTLNRVSA